MIAKIGRYATATLSKKGVIRLLSDTAESPSSGSSQSVLISTILAFVFGICILFLSS